MVSKEVFNAIDHFIFETLWRWARRRHPQKSTGWVREKFFYTLKGRNWVFFSKVKNNQGKERKIWLYWASRMPIKRHIKIGGQANPYEPAWEMYFEKRLGVKMDNKLSGKRKLLHLWKKQNGTCPRCNQKITKLTGWHNHHIVWKSKGGSDKAKNRVLLHPNCHRQVHRLNISIGKPRLVLQGV